MLQGILNKSCRQQFTKQQLYSDLIPITKTIQVRLTRHTGYCWRSRDVLISDKLMWTPSHGRTKAGRPARTNIQQLTADTGSSLEHHLGAMDHRDGCSGKGEEELCWQCDMMTMIIFIYNLRRLHTTNVNRSNTRNWSHTKKMQQADDSPVQAESLLDNLKQERVYVKK